MTGAGKWRIVRAVSFVEMFVNCGVSRRDGEVVRI